MKCTDLASTDLSSLISVLIGGFVAFVGSVLGSYLIERSKRKAESRNLSLAFYGEVHALISIVSLRRYIPHLTELIERMKTERRSRIFTLPIQQEYFRVYNENVKNIGLLSASLAKNITMFYTQANSVLEDIQVIQENKLVDLDIDSLISWHEDLRDLFQTTFDLGGTILKQIETNYNFH